MINVEIIKKIYTNVVKKVLDIFYRIVYIMFCSQEHTIYTIWYGSLVKRLRRRPLTAKTGVRFPYELLTVFKTAQPEKVLETFMFRVFFLLKFQKELIFLANQCRI